jgi:SAM-dependent methyltransferase
LIDYYSDYYSHFESGVTFDGDARFAQRLIGTGKVARTKKEVISILDFGGGVNAGLARAVARIILEEGRTEKVKLTLVDYNARNQKASPQTEVIAYRTLYEIPPQQTFDIIIASAIMEHVPNLGADLLILLKSLAPGGSAYFRTPSNSKMMRFLKNFGIRLDFTYPAHLHDLGQPFWARVLLALHLTDSYRLVRSEPAVVETDFWKAPVRTAAAWAMKAPWYVLGSKWANGRRLGSHYSAAFLGVKSGAADVPLGVGEGLGAGNAGDVESLLNDVARPAPGFIQRPP